LDATIKLKHYEYKFLLLHIVNLSILSLIYLSNNKIIQNVVHAPKIDHKGMSCIALKALKSLKNKIIINTRLF